MAAGAVTITASHANHQRERTGSTTVASPATMSPAATTYGVGAHANGTGRSRPRAMFSVAIAAPIATIGANVRACGPQQQRLSSVGVRAPLQHDGGAPPRRGVDPRGAADAAHPVCDRGAQTRAPPRGGRLEAAAVIVHGDVGPVRVHEPVHPHPLLAGVPRAVRHAFGGRGGHRLQHQRVAARRLRVTASATTWAAIIARHSGARARFGIPDGRPRAQPTR